VENVTVASERETRDFSTGKEKNGVKRANSARGKTVGRSVVILLVAAASLYVLYALSQWNYLFFHSSVEVFTLVVALATFAIAWNTRRLMDNKYLLFLGVAFLFVAVLGLLHTLTYRGMNVFAWVGVHPNVATQLWIAMRYLFAFSMLIPLLFAAKKIRSEFIIAGYSVVTVLLVASVFYWQNFPIAYVDSVGLTAFKVGSEYAISAILLVAIGILYVKRKDFSPSVFKLLMAAIATAVATEMAFTLYTDVYGIANMAGHLLNVVSFYFIYRALVETGLAKPYELLFRNLKQSEVNAANRAFELTKVNERLEQEIAEREAVEGALRESKDQLRLKLDSVLYPDVEIERQELSNILVTSSLQATLSDLYAVTKITFALLDLKGNVLAQTGWQDICVKFHRINPQTCQNCKESDVELSSGVRQGEIRLYKCKNNMWDVVTPLFIGGKHVGNIFSGQFFFEDEIVDRDLFVEQAKQYGFEEKAYMDAFNRVPRYSRKKIEDLMTFYANLSELISKLSYGNLKLAKSLINQQDMQFILQEKAEQIEEYSSRMEGLAEDRARQLKDAERMAAIGQTAGMVGHDIRNPLQAIVSELYLEKGDVEDLPDGDAKTALQESIKHIEDNLLYINKIVADLQDFARPLNPKQDKVDLENAIKEALSMVTIPENIQVSVSSEANLPKLIADSTMIKRILVNLNQNAVQAMPTGGKLTVTAKQKNRVIQISVEDTGEGIPADFRNKLFTPLMTTKSKGQGFGLAVVKRLVEAQGGNITFESEVGRGTKFTLQFSA
jgi:signal transduction histidine kinase